MTEEVREGEFAVGDAGAECRVFRVGEESVAQCEQGGLDAISETVASGNAFLRAIGAPVFQDAFRRWRAG